MRLERIEQIKVLFNIPREQKPFGNHRAGFPAHLFPKLPVLDQLDYPSGRFLDRGLMSRQQAEIAGSITLIFSN